METTEFTSNTSSRPIAKRIQEKVSNLKLKLTHRYLKFSDSSNIRFLIRNAFNYDLNKNDQHSKPNIWFYVRMIWFFVPWLVYCYQIYYHICCWSDQSRVVRNGVFMPGFALPKEICLVAAAASQMEILNMVWPSIKVLTNDPHIHLTMAPLRQICGAMPRPGDQLIEEEVILSVREQIRPLIAMTRIATVANFAVLYLLGLFSFFPPFRWATHPRKCDPNRSLASGNGNHFKQ